MYLNYKRKSLVLLLLLLIPFCVIAESSSKLKSINLDITTHLGDQQIFHAGDKLSFMLSLDQSAYVYVYYQDSENNLFQILPNAQHQQNFYNAGLYIPLPDEKASFSFRVEPPFGTDQVWAFAIDRQASTSKGRELENGLILISQSIDQVRNILKRQADLVFDESSKKIITRPN